MNEVRALTGIRGTAALTVFLAHTRAALEPRGIDLWVPTAIERLFLSGGRQVDIFFVLSGFILSMTYASWFDSNLHVKQYGRFLRKRFARIYPLHAFMLILVLCFVLVARIVHADVANGIGRFTFSSLVPNFLLIQAWYSDSADAANWNPPSWSISIEALAYLLFPVFLRSTVAIRRSRPWVMIAVIIGCGLICNAFVFWGQTGVEGIVRGLTEFVLGSCLASLYRHPLAVWLKSNVGSVVALVGLAICFVLTPDTGFVIAVFTAPLLLSLTGKNAVSAFFGWSPVHFLGEISYSIYLGQFLFTSIAYRLVSTAWMRSGHLATALGLLAIVAFVLSLSTMTYFGVERPGRQWLAGKRAGVREAVVAR